MGAKDSKTKMRGLGAGDGPRVSGICPARSPQEQRGGEGRSPRRRPGKRRTVFSMCRMQRLSLFFVALQKDRGPMRRSLGGRCGSTAGDSGARPALRWPSSVQGRSDVRQAGRFPGQEAAVCGWKAVTSGVPLAPGSKTLWRLVPGRSLGVLMKSVAQRTGPWPSLHESRANGSEACQGVPSTPGKSGSPECRHCLRPTLGRCGVWILLCLSPCS